ncbi:cyclopropane-fatty-acyl-phospholipid synthase [Halioglobus sp. HI00S01]|uniref:SAM-dependent methyltransferase n=1 Tax=Halioglobus sp. HI00S01 TaxID=1822214 RepID=UPI0007C253D7|nr:cyclopropane-fatty-acyl-phospholipid synthase family protein [Halioglobus sp. HI00S01]KZX58754.1 cyclopropane-fatty-acyl-phospholipid synthase [Halioglobus sp. HI00S01]
MSNPSVRFVRLPTLREHWRGGAFSRRIVMRMLEGISTGTLTVVEEGSRRVFGPGNGPEAVVHVHSDEVFASLLRSGIVGSGEAYMQGLWSSPDLVAVIRLFSANMQAMQAIDSNASWSKKLVRKLMHIGNANSKTGSARNISAHYDLGNDFFSLFLDPTMMYSAAVYPRADAVLEEAAVHKLDLLCQQLELTPEDHLLEIGTGWGGMAIHAATHYGCKVTTTTISQEQYEYARDKVAEAGLQEQVEVLCRDYRELQGQYDKLVSIEMVEAVGHQYYGEYFSRCSHLLKPGGLFAMQAITVQDQRYSQARDSVDFIKRYIFPGGGLPSIEVISGHLARGTDLQIVNLRDITLDYARTLADWRERFLAAREEVAAQGFDRTFERMWEFYLCYCEGGFRERIISTVQITMAKPGYRFQQ